MIETVAEIEEIEIGVIEMIEDFKENQDLNQKIFVLIAEILDIGKYFFQRNFYFLLFFNKIF